MEENQNPASPVLPASETPLQKPPANTEKPFGSLDSQANGAKSKLPILIIGIVLFLLIVVTVSGFYVFKQNFQASNLTPTTEILEKKSLNPNTGSFYKDVAQRLKEELK